MIDFYSQTFSLNAGSDRSATLTFFNKSPQTFLQRLQQSQRTQSNGNRKTVTKRLESNIFFPSSSLYIVNPLFPPCHTSIIVYTSTTTASWDTKLSNMESEGIRQRNADADEKIKPALESSAAVERAQPTPSHPAVQGWRMILIALYFLGSCLRYAATPLLH